MVDLVVPLLVVEAHQHRFHRATAVTLVSLQIFEPEFDFLVHQSLHVLLEGLDALLLRYLQGVLFGLGEQVIRFPLQVLDHHFDVVQLDAFSKERGGGCAAELSRLLPMLDVLQVAVEQILHEVELHLLEWERLEIVAFNVVRF